MLKEQLKNETEGKEKLQKDVTALEQQLSIEKAANEAEKRKNSILQEQIRDATYTKNSPCNTRNTSPTLSIGRVSMSESMGSFIWPTVNITENIKHLIIYTTFRMKDWI